MWTLYRYVPLKDWIRQAPAPHTHTSGLDLKMLKIPSHNHKEQIKIKKLYKNTIKMADNVHHKIWNHLKHNLNKIAAFKTHKQDQTNDYSLNRHKLKVSIELILFGYFLKVYCLQTKTGFIYTTGTQQINRRKHICVVYLRMKSIWFEHRQKSNKLLSFYLLLKT